MKRKTTLTLAALALVAGLAGFYHYWLSPTSIAFVNYQPIELQGLSQANTNPFIKLHSVSEKEVGKGLAKYDIIFVKGMGLRIEASQREALQAIASKGIPVYTSMATNPDNAISNLTVDETALIQQWMSSGSTQNYRSMLAFLRRNVDGKILLTGKPLPAEQKMSDYLYMGKEEFATVEEYEAWARSEGIFTEGAPRVVVTGQITDPRDLVEALVKTKRYNVYPLSVFTRLLEFVEQIQPQAIINLAHGRLGDDFVRYLEENNVLLFDPLTINDLADNWLADNKGMMGGFLSQSVIMPEIDGAIRTTALFAQKKDKNGLLTAYAMPDRLERFVETVNKYFDLRTKPNSEKRIAIVYFKGLGQSPLVASGMEVLPSLYALLTQMQAEHYDLGSLPPYEAFAKQMKASPRVQYGNVVLQMQPLAGTGKDEFQIVHGTDQDPPEDYVNTYLWIQNDFRADALIHFGTHGSLEFTPRKQVALSGNDWPDRLVGALPHFYVYTIDNVGEAMTAKRRAYAQIISYITPPYHESRMSGDYAELQQAIRDTDTARIRTLATKLGLDRDLGITAWDDTDLTRLEDYAAELMSEKVTGKPYVLGTPYDESDIRASVEAMTVDPIAYSRYNLDRLRGATNLDIATSRQVFEDTYIREAKRTVQSLYGGGEATDEQICDIAGITIDELAKARQYVEEKNAPKGMLAMMMAASRKQTNDSVQATKSTMATMMEKMKSAQFDIPPAKNSPIAKFMRHQMRKMMAKKDPELMLKVAKRMGAPDEALAKMREALTKQISPQAPEIPEGVTKKETMRGGEDLEAIIQIETAVKNVARYADLLRESPWGEVESILHALNGGYTSPSPGGDPVANPNTLPTGRNLFAVNTEATPSAEAWDKGVALAKQTIEQYRKAHEGEYPRKVSYTLWSGEFIQTAGATIAQVLYMLGVEPVRDRYDRVTDLRLIPDEELQRPRIDVVVQTSGQLRDLAASRLFLISRAVQMAAEAPKGDYGNMVREGVDESERYLVDKGFAPAEARKLAVRRVFGGLNGGYGSGIQSMIERGDLWDDDREVSDRYLYNMGAFYGDEDEWEAFSDEAFAAALTRTDVVVQPRQNNSWGALSLDHVYEFMGGLNLAVRNVTGKDPDALFSDYRNRNGYKMQDSKAAIGVEARTKLLNEAYIDESLMGGTNPTDGLSEMVRNTYGWNVMKPKNIDKEMWDEIYDVYVEDKHRLNLHERMGNVNPYAMMEMTATMMETARKGYWKATPEQLANIARLHTDFVKKYGASGSAFEMDNKKLQDFIAQNAPDASAYRQGLDRAQSDTKALRMEKQTTAQESKRSTLNGIAIAVGAALVFLIALALLRRRRVKSEPLR